MKIVLTIIALEVMQKRTYFQFENPAENLHFMVTSKINCQLFACKAAAPDKNTN
jgi:hypothetical protein